MLDNKTRSLLTKVFGGINSANELVNSYQSDLGQWTYQPNDLRKSIEHLISIGYLTVGHRPGDKSVQLTATGYIALSQSIFQVEELEAVKSIASSAKQQAESLQSQTITLKEQNESLQSQAETLKEQLELNKQLAEEAKADALSARRDANFAKRTTIAALILSGISILVAIAALFQPLWLPILQS